MVCGKTDRWVTLTNCHCVDTKLNLVPLGYMSEFLCNRIEKNGISSKGLPYRAPRKEIEGSRAPIANLWGNIDQKKF